MYIGIGTGASEGVEGVGYWLSRVLMANSQWPTISTSRKCKELEEVWLKRYRKLLGNEHVENRLTYFDRKLWATAIEADCEGYLFDDSKPNGVDAVMQIMLERCCDHARVDILMFRRDARNLTVQYPHSTHFTSHDGAVHLRQPPQVRSRAQVTHEEWLEWVVRQEAYDQSLGILKRSPAVDEETRLVRIASSAPHLKGTPASEVVNSALSGLKSLGIMLSKTVIQPYTTGIFSSERRPLEIGTMLSYRDTTNKCSVVPLHALLPDEEMTQEARNAERFKDELSARTTETNTAAVVHNVDLGLDDGVLYLPQFFTEESRRMRKHCIHGHYETTSIQRKLLLHTRSTGTLKFELFEQEFFCLKEKSIRKLSFRERFCSFVSLILTMGDDTRWLIDNECAEEVTKYFIEISKFSKIALKASNTELGLGNPAWKPSQDKSRHVLYEIFDTYKRMFSGAGQKFNWRPGKPKSEAWKAAQSASQRHRYKRARLEAEKAANAVIAAKRNVLGQGHDAGAAAEASEGQFMAVSSGSEGEDMAQ